MKSMQYTIRAIPPKLDRTLRQKSKATGKSLNDVVIDTLEKGAGISNRAAFNDLDWFIGSRSLDESFGKDQEWLDRMARSLCCPN